MEYKIGDIGPTGGIVFYDKGKIGKKGWRYLEAYKENAPKPMTWQEAIDYCAGLGNEYTLPSRKWLNRLYEAKDKVPGLGNSWFWSSSQDIDDYAWGQRFGDGYQDYGGKRLKYSVRACRAFA